MKQPEWISYKDSAGNARRCKWPGELRRTATPERITISLDNPSSAALGMLDPWGMACYGTYLSRSKNAHPYLMFEIAGEADPCHMEALKRRLSLLNDANSFGITLKVRGKKVALYSFDQLTALPVKGEVIDGDLTPLDDDHHEKSSALETHLFDPTGVMASLKAYLRRASMGRCPAHCCKGEVLRTITEFEKETLARGRTNRFAVLGEDFSSKRQFSALRAFPTGAFKGCADEESRLLPRSSVDVVTLNRHRQLALVALTADKSGLDVLSKTLNDALFFRLHWSKIMAKPEVAGTLGRQLKGHHIVSYIASNTFHPLFDLAAQYYSPTPPYAIELKKVALATTTKL